MNMCFFKLYKGEEKKNASPIKKGNMLQIMFYI